MAGIERAVPRECAAKIASLFNYRRETLHRSSLENLSGSEIGMSLNDGPDVKDSGSSGVPRGGGQPIQINPKLLGCGCFVPSVHPESISL